MHVVINGTQREIETRATVAEIVAGYKLEPKHVAVEINCELVPRRLFCDTVLKEGDQVEIVTLVGGG